VRRVELVALAALAGCATRRVADVSPDEINWSEATRVPTAPAPEPAEAADTSAAVLTRQVLADAASRGLGHFLSEVDVSPVVEGGRFVGFRLNSARHLRRWRRAGADLRPGDVITRVNDQPIDRPERAVGCLAALRDATELRVDLLRRGEPVRVRVAVAAAEVRSAP
jgi:type II secretory pathway component PulC